MVQEKIKRRGFLGFLAAAAAATGVTAPAVASVAAVEAPPAKNPESMADRVRAARQRPTAKASVVGPRHALPSCDQLAEARRQVFTFIANMQLCLYEITIRVGGTTMIRAMYQGECRGRALESFEKLGLMCSAEVTEDSPVYLADAARQVEYCIRGRRTVVVEWMVQ